MSYYMFGGLQVALPVLCGLALVGACVLFLLQHCSYSTGLILHIPCLLNPVVLALTINVCMCVCVCTDRVAMNIDLDCLLLPRCYSVPRERLRGATPCICAHAAD